MTTTERVTHYNITTDQVLPRSFDWMPSETLGQAFARLRREGLGDLHNVRTSEGRRRFHSDVAEGIRRIASDQVLTIGQATALWWCARMNEAEAIQTASTDAWLAANATDDAAGMDAADAAERSARAIRAAAARATGIRAADLYAEV